MTLLSEEANIPLKDPGNPNLTYAEGRRVLTQQLQKILSEGLGKDVSLDEAERIGAAWTRYFDLLLKSYQQARAPNNRKLD